MLRAQSIKKQLEQLRIQEKGRQEGIDRAAAIVGSKTVLTDATEAYYASLAPVMLFLLKEPADGGAPLTAEEFWELDTADPKRVIAAQEELTALEEALGNGLALQQLAGRQILESLKIDGSTSAPQSAEPGSPLTHTSPSKSGRFAGVWQRIGGLVASFGGKRTSR